MRQQSICNSGEQTKTDAVCAQCQNILVNVSVSLIQARARISLEEGTSTEKMLPSDCHIGKTLGPFSPLMIDVGGSSPLWEVSPLGKVILGI